MVQLQNLDFENDIMDNVSNYINANYINVIKKLFFYKFFVYFIKKTSFNHQKRIIATQGPLAVTFSNFWKMIFNEDVELIIMLCNLKENNKNQCDTYWPHKEAEFNEYPKHLDHKELKITLLSETIDNELYERTFLMVVGLNFFDFF